MHTHHFGGLARNTKSRIDESDVAITTMVTSSAKVENVSTFALPSLECEIKDAATTLENFKPRVFQHLEALEFKMRQAGAERRKNYMNARHRQVKAFTQLASRAVATETAPVSKLSIIVSTHTTETTLAFLHGEVASDLVMGGYGTDWARLMSKGVCAVLGEVPIAERIVLGAMVSVGGNVVTANACEVDYDQVACWSIEDAPPPAFVGAIQAASAMIEEQRKRHDIEMAKQENGAWRGALGRLDGAVDGH
jgi:hypothetical protein